MSTRNKSNKASAARVKEVQNKVSQDKPITLELVTNPTVTPEKPKPTMHDAGVGVIIGKYHLKGLFEVTNEMKNDNDFMKRLLYAIKIKVVK